MKICDHDHEELYFDDTRLESQPSEFTKLEITKENPLEIGDRVEVLKYAGEVVDINHGFATIELIRYRPTGVERFLVYQNRFSNKTAISTEVVRTYSVNQDPDTPTEQELRRAIGQPDCNHTYVNMSFDPFSPVRVCKHCDKEITI